MSKGPPKYPPISDGYRCRRCEIPMKEGPCTLTDKQENVIYCNNRLCNLYGLLIRKPYLEYEVVGLLDELRSKL